MGGGAGSTRNASSAGAVALPFGVVHLEQFVAAICDTGETVLAHVRKFAEPAATPSVGQSADGDE